MTPKKIGWLLATTSIVLYSTNTPIGRAAFVAGMRPMTLLFFRFVIATLFFIVFMHFSSLGSPSSTQRPLGKEGWKMTAISGMANGLTLVCLYMGLTRLPASLASMIGIVLYPIFVFLILLWRNEVPTRRDLTRLALGVVGLYYLLGPSGQVDWIGVLFVSLGSFLFSLHMVSIQWYLQSYNTWHTTSIMVYVATAIAGVMWLADGLFYGGLDFFVPGTIGWVAIFFQGIIATFIGRVVTYAAVSRVGSAQMSLLSPVETLLTLVWSLLFLGEVLLLEQWFGAALVLGGMLLSIEITKLPAWAAVQDWVLPESFPSAS